MPCRGLEDHWPADLPSFSHVAVSRGLPGAMLEAMCFDCDAAQLRRFHTSFDAVVAATKPPDVLACGYPGGNSSWLQTLLQEPGSGGGSADPRKLLLRKGAVPWKPLAGLNGGIMVRSGSDLPTLARLAQGLIDEPRFRATRDNPWNDMYLLYPMGGRAARTEETSAAYGSGRDSLFVFHYKHQWKTVGPDASAEHCTAVRRHQQLTSALAAASGCKSFYNYINYDLTCAGNSSDGWFQAHFSDVPRLRRVRSAADPGYVFHSYVTRARSPCVCAARTAEEKAVKAATLTRPRKGGATGAAGRAKAYPHRESMPRGHRVAFNASERGRAGCGHPRKSLKALKLLRARTDLSLVPGFVRGPPMATATHGSQPMQRHRQSGFAMPISCSDAAVTWNSASLSGLKNPSYGRCAVLDSATHIAAAPLEHHSAPVCVDHLRGVRELNSNGVPGHSVVAFTTHTYRPTMCEGCIKVSLPLHPRLLPHTTELPHFGPIGYTLSGLPLVGSAWPVWNGFIQKQQAWRGHGGSPETGYLWHYHHPAIKSDPTGEYARPDELIGWAMDGFPIYGPLPSGDACNGRIANGGYRYHVRRLEAINLSLPYCRSHGSGWATHWSLILGCFHGDVSRTTISQRSCLGW